MVFPILLIAAVLVFLNSFENPIFTQTRVGKGQKPFRIYKLRTIKHEFQDIEGHSTPLPSNSTRLGKFLRSSNIDELPQLWNVINGSMSLVGPRPHVTNQRISKSLYSDVYKEYEKRHLIKPGLTGLAQINGFTGPLDTYELGYWRLYYDLEYIERYSVSSYFFCFFSQIFQKLFGTKPQDYTLRRKK